MNKGLLTCELKNTFKEAVFVLSSMMLLQTFNSEKHFPNVIQHTVLQSSFSKRGIESPTFAKIKEALMRIFLFFICVPNGDISFLQY